MKPSHYRKAVTAVCVALWSVAGWAQPVTDQATTDQTTEQSAIVDTQINPAHEALARQWSLTTEEWERFETLRRGPRGYWTPNVDPLTALGTEARTDTERRRYAELQARMEFKRVERELAYQRAYDEAFARLYPGVLPVSEHMSRIDRALAVDQSRLALFIRPDCPKCDKQAKALQDKGAGFDVYMLDSKNDDTIIRDWAQKTGIAPEKVQQRIITLNHDQGTLESIFPGNEKLPLPATFKRSGDGWQRLD